MNLTEDKQYVKTLIELSNQEEKKGNIELALSLKEKANCIRKRLF